MPRLAVTIAPITLIFSSDIASALESETHEEAVYAMTTPFSHIIGLYFVFDSLSSPIVPLFDLSSQIGKLTIEYMQSIINPKAVKATEAVCSPQHLGYRSIADLRINREISPPAPLHITTSKLKLNVKSRLHYKRLTTAVDCARNNGTIHAPLYE
ncbi:hypothetical protein AB1N83_002774 [Pleurotus pulmonarius]